MNAIFIKISNKVWMIGIRHHNRNQCKIWQSRVHTNMFMNWVFSFEMKISCEEKRGSQVPILKPQLAIFYNCAGRWLLFSQGNHSKLGAHFHVEGGGPFLFLFYNIVLFADFSNIWMCALVQNLVMNISLRRLQMQYESLRIKLCPHNGSTTIQQPRILTIAHSS